jgi:hypothetical protein
MVARNEKHVDIVASPRLGCRLSRPPNMLLPRLLAPALALLLGSSLVSASALTTTVEANDKSCFYIDADKVGEKVSVSFCQFAYFGGRILSIRMLCFLKKKRILWMECEVADFLLLLLLFLELAIGRVLAR